VEVQGVVDRISNGYAVIICEQISKEFLVSEHKLNEGDWVTMLLSNGEIKDIKKDIEETRKRRRINHKKTDKLRKRMKSNFSK